MNNISGNIEAVFFKLGTKNVYHKRQNDTCCAVAMTTILPLVLS